MPTFKSFKPGGNFHQEPPDVAEFRKAARANERGFIRKHLKIITTESGDEGLKPLIPNYSQVQVLNAIEEQEKAGKPVRLVVLKSRRVGISTICSARIFAKGYATNNTNCMIIAHLAEVTDNLFDMQHKFLQFLPIDVQLPLKRSNKKELVWEAISSKIGLMTAGSENASRSRTIHHALCSEAAFYKDIRALRAALEATVPKHARASLIWETTAFGAGTEFHKMWDAAREGHIHYKPVFLEWFKDPACQWVEFESQQIQDAMLDDLFQRYPELKDRMKHYGLTPRQIYWYGYILQNDQSGNMMTMMQEYPMTPEEAFLASGTPVFPQVLFEKFKHNTKPGTKYEVASFKTFSDCKEDPYIKHEDLEHAYIEIWEKPREGRHYLISADPAKGIVGGDYSAACIFDIATQRLVGIVHGTLDLQSFADILKKLAEQYNHAVIMPEVTGIGAGLLPLIANNYFHIYQQRKEDTFTVEVTQKLGWETTTTSRVNMIVLARQLFIEHAIKKPGLFIPSKALVDEITTFVTGNLSKPEAAENCHDDLVMSWAMGLKGCLDELKTRPDIARTISSSKSGEEKVIWTPQDTIDMLRDPNYYPGFEYKPGSSVAADGPFIPMSQIEEEDIW